MRTHEIRPKSAHLRVRKVCGGSLIPAALLLILWAPPAALAAPSCADPGAGPQVVEWTVDSCTFPETTGFTTPDGAAGSNPGQASSSVAPALLRCAGFTACDPINNDVITKVELIWELSTAAGTTARLTAAGLSTTQASNGAVVMTTLDVTTAQTWTWDDIASISTTTDYQAGGGGIVVASVRVRVSYQACGPANIIECSGLEQRFVDACGFVGPATVDCNDGNACSQDYCTDGIGCEYLPTVCTFGDPCVDALCSPATGCYSQPKDCSDGDACTLDQCFGGACGHIPQDCDDGDACTVDTCAAGLCGHAALNCADANFCTDDSCDNTLGCRNVVVPSRTQTCYEGPGATRNVGACVDGVISCTSGIPSACAGQVLPSVDVCDTADNDCNGITDDGFGTGAACDGPDADACATGVVACSSAAATSCVHEGPLLAYRLDEAAGVDTLDASGNHLHGYTAAAVTAGKFGNARTLDGSQSIALPDFAALRQAHRAQTIALWIKPAISQTAVLVSRDGSFGLQLGADGSLAYTNSASGNLCYGCQGRFGFVTPGDWTHVAAVWNGVSMTMYVNGVSVGSTPLAGTFTPGLAVPRIGCAAGPSACTDSYFRGSLDDVVIYDYALSSPEIAGLLGGVPSSQQRAPRCGTDSDCSGSLDEVGANDCNVYFRDGDGDGFGRDDGLYPGVSARWGFEANDLSDAVTGAVPTRNNVVVRRDGRFARAVAFDSRGGATSQLTLTGLALPATASWSMSAMVRPDPASASGAIFVMNGWVLLEWDATINRYRLSVPGIAGAFVEAPGVAGQWEAVQGKWSGGNLQLRVGTASAFSKSGLNGTVPATSTGAMGGFTGSLDEVIIDGTSQSLAALAARTTGATAGNAECRCSPSASFTATKIGDCNDVASSVNPGATEACNNVDDNCDGTTDEGATASCGDGQACTTDSCVLGACTHVLAPGNCSIGGNCYVDGTPRPGSTCLACQVGLSTSAWSALPVGTGCNDGDACTTGDVCGGGNVCSGTPLVCDDNNRCTVNQCNSATGCTYAPQTGPTFPCYDGPPGTAGVGECKVGVVTCNAGVESACIDQQVPAQEVCDAKDNDCDNSTDEDFNIGQACDLGDRDNCASGVITCSGTLAARCVGDGPVVYLPLDAASGTATANASFGGKNAVLEGGAAIGAGAPGFGGGVTFDGVDDYLEVPAFGELPGGAAGLLVSFWVLKPTSGAQTFVSKLSSSSTNELFIGTRNGTLAVQLGTQSIDTGIPFDAAPTWTHVAVKAHAGLLKVYLGGELQLTTNLVSGVPALSATPWTFGRAASATASLAGGVDEIIIHTASDDPNLIGGAVLVSLETCDGIDNDCDGTTDEGYTLGVGACDSLDADSCAEGTATVCSASHMRALCVGDGAGFEFHLDGPDVRLHPSASGDIGPLTASGGAIVSGAVGNALRLDGTGFVRFPHSATTSASPLGTWAAWVRFDAVGDMAVFSSGTALGANLWSLARESGHPVLRVGAQTQVLQSTVWAEGTWYHVVVTLTASEAAVYLDAVEQPVLALSPVLVGVASAYGPIVGARRVGAGYGDRLKGAVDELRRSSSVYGDREVARAVFGEACDGLDDDCDGTTDESFTTLGQACSGTGTCFSPGTNVCNDELNGVRCSGAPVAAGTGCDDGNPCSKDDACDAAHECSGTPYVCGDGLSCTVDLCQGDGSCAYDTLPNSCAIDGACWAPDATKPGTPCLACKPGLNQLAWSAVAEGDACSDGSACTTGDACQAGVCVGATVDCGDGDDCTINACSPLAGCYQAGVLSGGEPCDDGKPCTTGTGCLVGLCTAGTATDCDDSNPCTADSCNSATGCVHTVIPYTEACYDGANGTKGVGVCTGGTRTCTGATLGACVGQVTPSTETCNGQDDDCNGVADEIFPGVGTACDGPDGDSCANGTLACRTDGFGTECLGDTSSAEVCDGLDNDCDGLTDEDFASLGQPCDGPDSDQCVDGVQGCSADGTGVVCIHDGASLLLLGDEPGAPLYVVRDQSGSGNDGQAFGAMRTATGVRGGGYLFDGADDLIRVPASPGLALGKAFTLSVYFNVSAVSSTVTLLQVNSGDCADVALRLNASGVPFALVEESKCGYATLTSGVTASKNVWHHVALVSTGTEYRLYYDGVLKKTNPALGLYESGAVELGGKPFAGLLDEASVWPYALSDTQIAVLGAAGPTREVEVCDGVDNNCDGATDENSSAEICDGLDNDCDGATDETFPTAGTTCYYPADSECPSATQVCNASGAGVGCVAGGPRVLFKFFAGAGNTAINLAGAGEAVASGGGLTWIAAGADGPAVALDGATSLSMSATPALSLPGAGVSLQVSVRPDALGAASLVRRSGIYELGLDATGHPRCTIEGAVSGGPVTATSGTALPVGSWTRLLCAYDRGAIRLYVNGALSALAHTTGGNMPPILASDLDLGVGFAGGLDEVAISDIALSDAAAVSLTPWGPAAYRRDICDGINNDCDSETDEDSPLLGQRCDADSDGCKNGTYTCGPSLGAECVGDIPANGAELCNGLDDNCDGQADETFAGLGAPCDGADADSCASGVLQCAADQLGTECVGDSNIAEACNGLDDDCDGLTDEDFNIGQTCDGGDADLCAQGSWACRANGSGAYCRFDGPVLELRFDEGNGTVLSSASGDVPAPTLVGSTTWSAEGAGFALNFLAGTYVRVPDDASLDTPTAVTAAVRAKIADVNAAGNLLAKGTGGGLNYSLGFSGGNIRCRAAGKAPPNCDVAPVGDAGQWHSYACVITASATHVYQDGALLKTCAAAGALVTNGDPLEVGAVTGTSGVSLDWANVWSKALSPAEIAALHMGGEACDGVDNDCDLQTDEGFAALGSACDSTDADLCALGTVACSANFLGTSCDGDVNQVESCNGVDDDCDGVTDNGYPGLGTACDSADPDSCANGLVTCTVDGTGTSCQGDLNQAELCDGLDNDCDGTTDLGVAGLGVACDGDDSDLCSDGVNYCDLTQGKVLCDEVGTRLWLKLDEPAGATATADASRYAQPITTVSNAAFGGVGHSGGAADFAFPGRLEGAATVAPFDGLGAFTLGAWVKHNGPFSAGDLETVAGVSSDGTEQVSLFLDGTGLGVGIRRAGAPASARITCQTGVAGCSAVVSTGTWHHVAAVFLAGQVDLYLDGELVRRGSIDGATVAPRMVGERFLVGAKGAGLGAPFNGLIDDVVVYVRPLSPAEMLDLVARGPAADAVELCDGLDNNCDGNVDEGLGLGVTCDGPDGDSCATGVTVCAGNGSGTRCDDSGTLLWYPLDGSTARVRDQGSLGVDLVAGAGVSSVPGKAGGARDFDGGSARGGSRNVLGGAKNATWAAWIRPNSLSGLSVIVSQHAVAASLGRSWAFGQDDDGLFLRLRTSETSLLPRTHSCNGSTTCGASLSIGQWAFVTAVFKTGSATFYVNGVAKGTFSYDGFTIASPLPIEPVMVGGDADNEFNPFDGALDDVRVYDRALSTGDIQRLFKQSQGLLLDLCDGVDDDCDGLTDEDFPLKGMACDGPDSDLCANGVYSCASSTLALECGAETVTDIPETCNLLDDDCDGTTDEGFAGAGDPCDGPDADSCMEGVQGCDETGGQLVCLREGPINLWRFDEAAGSLAIDTASSAGNHDLILSNTLWGTGRFGSSLDLAGNGGGGKAAVAIGGRRTLTLWVKPTAGGYLYGQGAAGSFHFGGYWAAGVFTHYHMDNGTQRAVSANIPSGVWTQLAIVMEPGKPDGLRLYVDCVQADSAQLSQNNAVGDFSLGRAPGLSDYFTGSLDEVAVYDYTVAPARLCALKTIALENTYANRELCDSVDNDCSGVTDDGLTGVIGASCDGPDSDSCKTGTYTCRTDLMDVECANETVAAKTEVCNGADDDCDGAVDEGFEYLGIAVGFPCDPPGECGPGVVECGSATKAVCSTGPGGSASQVKGESCDNKDTDCDGLIDEKGDGSPVTENCYTGPVGTVNVGTCKYGQRLCVSGAFGSCVGDVTPAATDAQCDGIDQNCNGVADEGYHDAYACTQDTCTGGVALSVPDNALCDDANPCTDDTCTALVAANGGCSFFPDNSNVLDQSTYGQACRRAICQGGTILQQVDDSNVVDDGLVCTTDSCDQGAPLAAVLPGYCLIAGVCYAEGTVNPGNGCQVCSTSVSTSTWSKYVHVANFDAGVADLSGYTTTELVGGGVSWVVDSLESATGTNSLYFGNPATHTYEQAGARVAARATSPLVVLPPGTRYLLTFQVRMATEGFTGSDRYDTLTVNVVDEDSGEIFEVWDSMNQLGNDTAGIFEQAIVELSDYAGRNVRLEFEFDSGDAYFNDYDGVYLDQIRVETGCCFSHAQCDTGDPCYAGTCVNAKCVESQVCSECKRSQTSLVVLVDRSLSMASTTGGGQTRWDTLRVGLANVLPDYDQVLNMGLKVFPSDSAVGLCDVDPGLDVDFHSSSGVVQSYLTGLAPYGQSPMEFAVNEAFAAYGTPAAQGTTGNKFVLLLTDGAESCAGDPIAGLDVLQANGVKTVVVAFDPAADRPALSDYAIAGGFGRPRSVVSDPVYFSAGATQTDFDTALRGALDRITGEACNGVDDDCDGTVDNDAPAIACNLDCNEKVGGFRTCSFGKYGSCSITPVVEICDEKDNDCDGLQDEDFPLKGTPCSEGTGACYSPGIYVCTGNSVGQPVECNAPPIFGTAEICNTVDDDCDGETDENVTKPCATICGVGVDTCVGGAFVCDAPVPVPEVCDGLDENCNGTVDDVVPVPCVGVCGNGFEVCQGGAVTGCSADGKPEICNGIDDDCDGLTDEDVSGNPIIDPCLPAVAPGLVGECAVGTMLCSGGVYLTCVPNQLPSAELCDGVDNDCNGLTDDTPGGTPIIVDCYDPAYPGTADVGACKKGTRTCDGAGTLGQCTGLVTPQVEVCNGIDDDCDGSTDEDPGQICLFEAGCAQSGCLCGKNQNGTYRCYLD